MCFSVKTFAHGRRTGEDDGKSESKTVMAGEEAPPLHCQFVPNARLAGHNGATQRAAARAAPTRL